LLIIQAATIMERQSAGWLAGVGFRVHASPVEHYLEKCRKFEFIESGATQFIGDCEIREYDVGFPATVVLRVVIYDPTQNLLRPEAQRPPGWKRAFDSILDNGVAILKVRDVRALFADFYVVYLAY
jgi:hypothetical protein